MKTPKLSFQRLMTSALLAPITAVPARAQRITSRTLPGNGVDPGKADSLDRTGPWARGAETWSRTLRLTPESSVASLKRILAAPQWKMLSGAQKTLVAHIAARSNAKGLAALATLVEKPASLEQKDGSGASLLVLLVQLATRKMDPRPPSTPDALPVECHGGSLRHRR